MTDKPYGTLYIGMTGHLIKRIHEHKCAQIDGFTKRFGLKTLLYYEEHATAPLAIAREKVLKKWRRDWKIQLISSFNPTWRDLYDDLAV